MAIFDIAPSPRAAITLVYFTFGTAIGAMAGSIPAIMENAGLSSETLGLGLTLSTVATVIAMSAGGRIARYASPRSVLLGTLPAFAAALLAFLLSYSPVWFFLSIPALGACFGLTDLFMNAEAVAIEHDQRRPIFMAFHGSVSIGVAIMAILASALSALSGTWATATLISALFALCWLLVYRNVAARPLAEGKAARLSTLPNKLPLTLLGISAGLIIAAETTALLWSAKLLDQQAPSLAAISGLGAAFFGICNALMRFPGDRLRQMFGDHALLPASLVVSMAGFIALGVSGGFVVSIVAFAGVGFGLSLLIPCIFSLGSGLVPENRAGALSYVSLLTAVPRCLAPGVFGFVAAGVGM